MDIKRIYLSIGAILVIAIVVFLLVSGDGNDPADPAQAGQQLPPGHPDVSGQMGGAGAPGRENVRQDFIQRLEELREIVKKQSPSDTANILALARMLSDSHQSAEALPLLERYHAAAPKNIPVMLDMAVAYYELRQYDKALQITKKTLALEPQNGVASYNLGAIYATLEKPADARAAWNALIQRDPKSPDAQRAMEAMKQLDAPAAK